MKPSSKMHMLLASMIALLLPSLLAAQQPAYLFTSFRGNGEDGLHLAFSRDGYTWTALKNDQSFLKPVVGGKLMRDPSIVQDPDGTFHMVWTTGWWDKGFGYASSKDLITWSEQRYIAVNEKVDKAKNTWAPDLFYDAASKQYYILFSTTVPGRFPETDREADHNHRIYFVTTRDFTAFSEPTLFYNPGHNCIDGTLLRVDGRYLLIFKDERIGKKCLKITAADRIEGPYGPPSESLAGDWIEGPSAVKIGDEYFVYFDHYANPHYYGGAKSKDLKTWENVSPRMTFPKNMRHGTVLPISHDGLQRLLGE